jgi:plastocyanin
MSGTKNGNTFSFDLEIPDALEDLHFWIEAADKVGNPSVTPMIDIPVQDNDIPEITEDLSDGLATTGDPYHLEIVCIDNIAVSKVDVSYLLPGAGTPVVAPLTRDGDTFSYTLEVPNDRKGEMTYTILAYDSSMNVLETDPFEVVIEDDEAPVAVITGPKKVAQHDTVTLTAMGSTDNVGITSYSWAFDEKSFDTMEVTYTFDDAGLFLIELIVDDGSNPASKAELLLTVVDIDDPIIALVAPETIGNHLTFFANASDSTDNVGIASFNWLIIMPDNNRVTAVGPTYSMGLSGVLGELIIYLTVIDTTGNDAQVVKFVQVVDNQAPTVKAPAEMQVQAGERVTFSDMGSSDNVGVSAYLWLVKDPNGDTISVSGSRLTYFFEKDGNYTVTLTVYDSSGNNASGVFWVEALKNAEGYDSDGDGMSDKDEMDYGLDPDDPTDADRDPDRDLVSNKVELGLETDPMNADTDGDGMPDGWEISNKIDPKVNDANGDADGDGVTNLREYLADRNPQVKDNPKEKKDSSVLVLVLAIFAIIFVLAVIVAIVMFASKLPES